MKKEEGAFVVATRAKVRQLEKVNELRERAIFGRSSRSLRKERKKLKTSGLIEFAEKT